MSIAAPNAAIFYREVSVSRVVWAIRDNKGFPAPVNGNNKRAMPFWSSESRALKVIANVKTYEGFRAEPILWEIFSQRWIPGLTKDGILAGLNWAGSNATGYDVEPTELEQNILALLNESGTQPIIPPDVIRWQMATHDGFSLVGWARFMCPRGLEEQAKSPAP